MNVSLIPGIRFVTEPLFFKEDSQSPKQTIGFTRLEKKYDILSDLKTQVCAPCAPRNERSEYIGSGVFGTSKSLYLTSHQLVSASNRLNLWLHVYAKGLVSRTRAKTQWVDEARDVAAARLKLPLKADENASPVTWFSKPKYSGDALFVFYVDNPLRMHASRGFVYSWPEDTNAPWRKIRAFGAIPNGASGGGAFTPEGECLGILDSGAQFDVEITPAREVQAAARCRLSFAEKQSLKGELSC